MPSKIAKLAERVERQRLANQTHNDTPPFDLPSIVSPKQLEFLSNPSKRKVAVCSRRAGKTTALAVKLLHAAVTDADTVSLYVTVRRTQAKKIVWSTIKKFNTLYRLGGEPNESELSMRFPNNSVIYVSGAKDANEIEHIRGLPLRLVVIDEAQNFREYLKDLIDDVIEPALLDFGNSELLLCGTPRAIPTGYFFDQTKNPAYAHFHWTFFDNPYLPFLAKGYTHQQQVEEVAKARGVGLNHPTIRREYFGEWTKDDDSLLLHYDETRNDFHQLPPLTAPHVWGYIMGVDLGFHDADAIAVLAYSHGSPNTYLVEEVVCAQQDITSLSNAIEELRGRYDVHKIVMDTGGIGKKVAEEFSRRKSIPCVAADKTLKLTSCKLLDDALRSGKFRAGRATRFAQDCSLVEIDEEKTTPDRLVVHSNYHSDILDATLYAFKECPGFAFEAPLEPFAEGTPQWEAEVLWKHNLERLNAEQKAKDEPTRTWTLDQTGTPPWNKWEE